MKTLTKDVPLEAIAASGTNPRKHFDDKALADLTESIRKHGVLQPILVRPLPAGTTRVTHAVTLPGDGPEVWGVGRGHGSDCVLIRTGLRKKDAERLAEELKSATHLLIAGERRWKAAQAAGLKEIPVIVRELDDKAALEIQVIENLQREDLHPLEEAEGYRNLMDHHQYSAEDLAAKVGKSKAYIYARLKLTELGPEGRKALWDGKINHSIGLLLARVHNLELQKQALKEVLRGEWGGAPMSEKQVRKHLQEHYMLRLADAPFDTRDADLVPAAGACATCPKRTGNQKELFADVQSADVCTDPVCFAQKKEAAGARKLEAAMKAGQEVVATGSAFSKYGELSKEYVDLKDRCEALGWNHRDTWRKTLGKHAPTPIVTVDPEGQVHEILWATNAKAALKAAGHKKVQSSSNGYSARERAKAKKKQALQAVAGVAIGQILPNLAAPLLAPRSRAGGKLWAFLARSAAEMVGYEAEIAIATRRVLLKDDQKKTYGAAGTALTKWLKTTKDTAALQGFVLEVMLLSMPVSHSGTWCPDFKALASLAGVNLAKCEKQAGEKKGKPQRKATAKGKKK